MTAFRLLTAAALLGSAAALCPEACNGHGSCGEHDKCTCYANYQGNNCAFKTCPFTEAWSSDGAAHSYAECGNRGFCNRATGTCECYDGYEGKGCARLSCIEGCSGHGTCELMSEVNTGYTGWDADKIMTCKCDPGYEGPDCSSRMCMPGDDPMSLRQALDPANLQSNEVQTITIASGDGTSLAEGSFTIKFTDWRGETWETYPIKLTGVAPAAAGFEVKEALEALPNHAVPSVDVAVTVDTADIAWAITFTSSANSGDIPLLEINHTPCDTQGCQPYLAGLAIGTASGEAETPAVVETTKGTTERYICSGRGECDSENGLCDCYEGYTGQACEQQTIIM